MNAGLLSLSDTSGVKMNSGASHPRKDLEVYLVNLMILKGLNISCVVPQNGMTCQSYSSTPFYVSHCIEAYVKFTVEFVAFFVLCRRVCDNEIRLWSDGWVAG